MEGQKNKVIIDIALRLQGIKQGNKKEIGISKQSFQLKLEKIKEKLEIVESQLIAFKEKVGSLKSLKPTYKQESAQNTHANTKRQKPVSNKPVKDLEYYADSSTLAIRNALTISSSSKVTNRVKATKPHLKSYALITASTVTQSAPDKLQTKVTSNNSKQKSTASSLKTKPAKKKVIFQRKTTFSQQSEVDLMLV